MKKPRETWFFRGREARGLGLARTLPDGRLAPANRAEWYRGYDEEARRQAALHATPEQLEEARTVARRLGDWIAEHSQKAAVQQRKLV